MNEFRYKTVNLSILLDGQYGGEMYSQTSHKNNTLGKTKVTLPGRDAGIIGDGVVKLANGTFVQNTAVAQASAYYDNYYQNQFSLQVQDYHFVVFVQLNELCLFQIL
jgi:hypothetical protein